MYIYEVFNNIFLWYERVMKKYSKYLEVYKICGINIKNDDKIIKFIEENEIYLKNCLN